MGTKGRISNCTNAADILCTGDWVGGIVGYNYGEISNCRNLADIQGARKVGGICGFNNQVKDWDAQPPVVTSWGTIKNCYNTGAVTSTTGSEAGGICGSSSPAKGTALFNNYCIDSVTYGCWWSTDRTKGFLKGAVESKTAEQFASGEVAYLLNSGKTDGTQVWLQTIGTDFLPQFTGTTVYQVEQYDCPADTTAAIAYSNTDSEIRGTEHSFTHYTSNNDSTCTADGTKTATCDYCDETDTITDTGSMKAHDCDYHEAKVPTCTEPGHKAYWVCGMCDKYFIDEECTDEIALAHTVISATGHGETETKNTKEATCTEEGYTGDKVCKDCGEVVEKGKPIAKVAHTYEDGKCTVCGAADPDYKPSDAPQTGDNSNMALWIALLFTSATGIIGTAVFSRKRKKQAK